jgi:hypothetical protein
MTVRKKEDALPATALGVLLPLGHERCTCRTLRGAVPGPAESRARWLGIGCRRSLPRSRKAQPMRLVMELLEEMRNPLLVAQAATHRSCR